jgi:hypothetical protein
MTYRPNFIALALVLLHGGLVEASLFSYIRRGGDLSGKPAALPLDDILLRPEDAQAQSQEESEYEYLWNESDSRQLQASSLALDSSFNSTFMSQVNKTYVFPQSLNPDCAAGDEIVIGVTQLHIEGVNRTTGEHIFANSLRWLFRTFQVPDLLPKGVQMMSPRVVYDSDTDRFMVVSTMSNKESFSYIYLAVSKEMTPLSGREEDWNVFVIDVWDTVNNENVWANELSISVGLGALYVTATMYTTELLLDEGVDSFVESRVWIMGKSGLAFSNNPTALTTAVDGTLNFSPDMFSDVRALDHSGVKLGPYIPAAGDSGAYLVAYNDQVTTDTEELHVVRITTGLTVSNNVINLGDIDIGGVGGPLPGASQPDVEYATIETGNRLVNDAVLLGDTLHVATTVEFFEGETAVFWAKIDIPSMLIPPGDSGLITGELIAVNTSTFFPSIAVNNAGDMVVGFGASGTVYAGMYATLVTVDESVAIKAGEDNYESLDGLTYHGQYSGMSADPVDISCFWAFNSFARMNAPAEWHTWERGALAVQWGKVCLQ